MTSKQEEFSKRLKRFFDNSDQYYYSLTMQRAQRDSNFEQFIQSMTVDRIAGRSQLEKMKYRF